LAGTRSTCPLRKTISEQEVSLDQSPLMALSVHTTASLAGTLQTWLAILLGAL
jgi:hypothetical protein